MMRRTRLAAAAVVTALLAAPSAGGVTAQPVERGITVTGTASVTVVPDRAGFRFGVTTQGSTAAGTLAAAAAAARGLVDAIEGAGVRAGATEVDGPSFSRSNAGELYRGALASAVADARSKAQAIATAAGASVGLVLEVREGSEAGGAALAAAAPATGPSIEPGTIEIDAAVTVTFAAA